MWEKIPWFRFPTRNIAKRGKDANDSGYIVPKKWGSPVSQKKGYKVLTHVYRSTRWDVRALLKKSVFVIPTFTASTNTYVSFKWRPRVGESGSGYHFLVR